MPNVERLECTSRLSGQTDQRLLGINRPQVIVQTEQIHTQLLTVISFIVSTLLIVFLSSLFPLAPPKGGWCFLMSPPCLESRGFQFDPTFYISSFVLLHSPLAVSVLSSFSAFVPFS